MVGRNKKGQFQKGCQKPKNAFKFPKGHKINTGKPSSFKGKHHSEKSIKQMRRHSLGQIPWNKGKTGVQKHSKDWKEKMRQKRMERKEKLGYINSPETRKKLSKALKGEKSSFWKGGISPKNIRIRMSIEYRLWREAVFAQDNWTCQKYGERGGRLHPHHIKNFAQYPELRFAIDNGITLSEKAHKEFHKIYGKKNNTREQLIEFLNARKKYK